MTRRPSTSSATARPLGVMEAGAPVPPSTAGAPIFLSLPVPPSVNRAYANGKGKGKRARFYSQVAEDWKGYARHVLRAQKPAMMRGPVIVVMNVERKSPSADIDNRTKLLLDLLVSERVIEDDRFVSALATAWAPKHSDRVHLVILPAAQLAITFHPTEKTGAVGGWVINAPNQSEEEAA